MCFGASVKLHQLKVHENIISSLNTTQAKVILSLPMKQSYLIQVDSVESYATDV